MLFKLISDVHLDVTSPYTLFKYFTEAETDKDTVLLLAGDIGGFNGLIHNHTDYVDHFFKTLSDRFKQVLYVIGNHESYYGTYEDRLDDIKLYLSQYSNITFMDNDIVEFVEEGVVVIGSTLWSNFRDGNYLEMDIAYRVMNDYRTISIYDKGSPVSLRPTHVLAMFNENLKYITTKLEQYKDKKIVVMTHHAPSYQSIADEYKLSKWNSAYASSLDELIMQYQPILWVHGHCHHYMNYHIDNTNIVCNPFGYGVRENTGFINDLI